MLADVDAKFDCWRKGTRFFSGAKCDCWRRTHFVSFLLLLLLVHVNVETFVCIEERSTMYRHTWARQDKSSAETLQLTVDTSLRINETLKWLSSLPILMQESFWWWQRSDRYIISPTSILTPPLLPFLISVLGSVDVKHHVYCSAEQAEPRRDQEEGGGAGIS